MLGDIAVGNLTASGLLGLAVMLLLTGRIVPRVTLQDKIQECERWRLAYEAEREARATSDKQTSELLEVAKTTQHFITAVFTNSERLRQSGEPDGVPSQT